jgi:hypothetical protein
MICYLCKLETGPHHVTQDDGEGGRRSFHVPMGTACDIAAHAVAGVFRDGILPISQKLEEIRCEIGLRRMSPG